MKKKFALFKTIQLALIMALTVAGLIVIFTDSELYQMVGRNSSVFALSLLLWLALALSYLGVFWDFSTHSSFKKSYRELDYIVHNDPVAGIANRYSCDAMIEKYADRPLPDDVGCVMLDLVNLREINARQGHAGGNALILEFSNILHAASLGLCFVGRNGGNKFMALFESCNEEKLSTFLARVNRQVDAYNAREAASRIEYRTGQAFSRDEHAESINQLISLADRRLSPKSDSMTGLSSRTGCDDVIAPYLDKPLPEHIGCVMLEIANIRRINDAAGRLAGNRAIRQLGDILREAADGLCFVGRNGGAKFLALFENCGEDSIDAFLARVNRQVDDYNAHSDTPIDCRWGRAFHEGAKIANINQLIALADRRISGEGR